MTNASTRIIAGLMVAVALFIQGCARTQPDDPPGRTVPASLDQCCTDLEEYPLWLVDAARLIAPQVGRVSNAIAWRRGYIDDKREARSAILKTLRPLDIVLVSSKGRKSGQAIPGLFGHAAVYTGTQRELTVLGVWNAPEIRLHRNRIRSAHPFIEADAKGVHLSPASVVLNTDRVVVLRPGIADPVRRRQIARGFFDAIGMDFDFLFDVESSDCTFCTELIHRVMPELKLPVQPVYGVNTILPDRVAASALLRKSRLDLVLYVKADRQGWRQGSARELIDDIGKHWQRRNRR